MTSRGLRKLSFFLGLCLAAHVASGEVARSFVFDFKNDMEGWLSYRGSWRWSDRDSLANTLPADSIDDGFAVVDTVGSDELYTPYFNATSGATFTLTFFLRSRWEGSNSMYVDMQKRGQQMTLFIDLNDYSSQFSSSWITVTGEIPPSEEDVMLIVFCYNGDVAPAGSLMYGCAIDQIQIDLHGDETTTQTSTVATTTSPETTDASTKAPETTAEPTEAPETTAEPTEAPETTVEPTEAPETTAEPTQVPETTEGPNRILEYNFQSSVQGWTLSQMNGAAWKRVEFEGASHQVSPPPEGPWVLQVFPEHIFAGTALAQSPKLRAIGSSLTVDLTFWMDGTKDLPTKLKARRREGFSTFDVEPIMNLDPYGNQMNYEWVMFRASIHDLVPGETFTITLEGSLGGNPNNSVAINKVVLDGVEEIPTDTTEFIDFEGGLFGWSAGNMDGGRWVLKCWADLDPSLNVPQPSDGKNFLFVDRFDIHSGVISLESPAFTVSPGQRKKVVVTFWLRGSVVYPAVLRLRKKTVNGIYDDLPFLNLAQYGDIDNPDWIQLNREYEIPVDETEEAFQLVIEADLGSDAGNMAALDDLKIITEYITP
ncbi:putative mucin-2-like [Penaeus vannamei]|uniref:Putative mucin-2-like n=1 Tax=Penaeus vannamei TaxID=6689 RepID=A0A3R7LW35_PENVA|nr:uncharacterized protein LOC113821398 [Penaeus vannamei]ROT64662.1 putative mucin-2-like [Penaeus vannamei]